MRSPNSMSKRLRSQSSERMAVVSGPIPSHCSVRRGGATAAGASILAKACSRSILAFVRVSWGAGSCWRLPDRGRAAEGSPVGRVRPGLPPAGPAGRDRAGGLQENRCFPTNSLAGLISLAGLNGAMRKSEPRHDCPGSKHCRPWDSLPVRRQPEPVRGSLIVRRWRRDHKQTEPTVWQVPAAARPAWASAGTPEKGQNAVAAVDLIDFRRWNVHRSAHHRRKTALGFPLVSSRA